jgi:hypothetical protein
MGNLMMVLRSMLAFSGDNARGPKIIVQFFLLKDEKFELGFQSLYFYSTP